MPAGVACSTPFLVGFLWLHRRTFLSPTGFIKATEELVPVGDRNLQTVLGFLLLVALADEWLILLRHRASILAMRHPLAGCRAKLDRANEHIGSLEKKVKGFLKKQPYKVVFDPTPYRGRPRLVANIRREPPTEEWGALMGEIIHDVRSSLGHLVWQLTLDNKGEPPEPLARRWKDIEFPIYDDCDLYFGRIRNTRVRPASRLLWGVDPKLGTVFERLQPYRRRKSHRYWLWVLNELWNADKHRTYPLVGFFVEFPNYTINDPFQMRIIKSRDPGPVEDGTPVASVKVFATEPADTPPKLRVGDRIEVQMEIAPTFDIAFKKGPPAYGGRLVQTLKNFHSRVGKIIDLFDRTVFTPRLF
jgi:hypothetical protein